MPLNLSWTDATRLVVEGGTLRPDILQGLSTDELAHYPVPVGNGTVELAELFRISGSVDDGELIVEGDLRSIRALGWRMTTGRLTIHGDVGPHLGAEMSGGTIDLHGSAGDYAGAALRGGLLRIRMSAGDHLGAALPGDRIGMREGVILVEGAVGESAGLAMRRGTIAIAGPAGDGLGRGLVAGSIFAFGPVGRRAGAGMKRGTLALFGGLRTELLPTFRFACCYRPPFLTLYLRQLQAWGFPVPETTYCGIFERYNGDLLEGGHGEILVWNGG